MSKAAKGKICSFSLFITLALKINRTMHIEIRLVEWVGSLKLSWRCVITSWISMELLTMPFMLITVNMVILFIYLHIWVICCFHCFVLRSFLTVLGDMGLFYFSSFFMLYKVLRLCHWLCIVDDQLINCSFDCFFEFSDVELVRWRIAPFICILFLWHTLSHHIGCWSMLEVLKNVGSLITYRCHN